MADNPWMPPSIQEEPTPLTPPWRLCFGWIATGLSATFAVSVLTFVFLQAYFAVPFSVLISLALWDVGRKLRLNQPVP